jgi:hypothetical protein
MNELFKPILVLTNDVKEVKACLQKIVQSRAELFKQNWVDGQEVMIALNISKRTLQTLRDNGTLPYSRINGKFYYKVSDLEALLESNYTANFKKSDSYGD